MYSIKLPIILLVAVCSFSNNLEAQKNVETQRLLWTGYSLKFKINDRYQIRQELEERFYYSPVRQHQFVCRSLAERQIGTDWNVGLGITYMIQSLPHDPDVADYYNQSELRPQLEIAYKQKLSKKISLNHRYWTEFRFFEQEHGSFDYKTNRTRYKLEIRYTPVTQVTLKAFDEIHFNLGSEIVQNVFDQNRYGASVQYMPLENLGFEVGYLNWFQQQKSGIDFYNRHIIRLTLHHRINYKTSKAI